MTGIKLSTPVQSIYSLERSGRCDAGINYDGDGDPKGSGYLDRYQCVECGYQLQNPDGSVIVDTDDLRAWMERHGVVQEIAEDQ